MAAVWPDEGSIGYVWSPRLPWGATDDSEVRIVAVMCVDRNRSWRTWEWGDITFRTNGQGVVHPSPEAVARSVLNALCQRFRPWEQGLGRNNISAEEFRRGVRRVLRELESHA